MSGLAAERVLVPVDFTDESLAAVDKALEIAGNASGVHIVHVLPDLNPGEPGVIWNVINDDGRAEHVKNAIGKRLDDDKYKGVETHVAFGDPGSQIARMSETVGADLIVLPSHGRSGLSRLLLGSVAERVLRLAHCPVLVLRT